MNHPLAAFLLIVSRVHAQDPVLTKTAKDAYDVFTSNVDIDEHAS